MPNENTQNPNRGRAVRYFLEVDGIEGDATAAGFEKQIPVYDMNYGAGRNASTSPGETNQPGEQGAYTDSMRLVKARDKTSPLFFVAACTDKAASKVVLSEVVQGPDGLVAKQTYTLDNGLIHGFRQYHDSEGVPLEEISIAPLVVELKTTEIKPDTTESSPVVGGVDFNTSKKK